MLRYAITDGTAAGRTALPATLRRWSAQGIDFVQLREKSLPAGELFELARSLLTQLKETGSSLRLLLNARADVALATGAHGVHLTAAPGELLPSQVRSLFAKAASDERAMPLLSVACHTHADVARAREGGADLILFSPIFGKVAGGTTVAAGIGLAALADAVRVAGSTPVLALGGVTKENASACLHVGAAGIAGIRLFA